MSEVNRVLDANINRAAEGMRVLEDIARFVLENQELCASIKNSRHQLRMQTPRITNRNIKGDVGTAVSTKQEQTRDSILDIALAAGNRCGEALRVIEEFLKLTNESRAVEAIRYKMYELAAEVTTSLGVHTKRQWNLCFVMTMDECVLPWQDTLAQTLVSGSDCVQVREKEMCTSDLVLHVQEVIAIAKTYGAQVIVNDRVDVMLASNASGVHLGESDMPIKDARKLSGSTFIVGATAHTSKAIEECMAQGADYVGVGAMFATKTKPESAVAPLVVLKNALVYPHLAIGGINPHNVQDLYNEGCKGVAVSSAIAHSKTPEKIVASLLSPEHQSV